MVEVQFEQVELYSGNFNSFILNVDSSCMEHTYTKASPIQAQKDSIYSLKHIISCVVFINLI